MTSDDEVSGATNLLPEQRVGAAMRAARELNGISLRQMSKRLNYHSHTTLSSYERGAVMPTEEAVQGYEQVLGLEPGVLTDVLERARIERHGDAWAKRRVHLPAEFVRLEPTASPQRVVQRFGSPRRRRVLIVCTTAVVILATLVGISLALRHPNASSHRPAAVVRVSDGSDPKVTGCATGAITADSVDVYDPPQHLAGVLELRTSARCGASWGRFTPTSALGTKPAFKLEIDVRRPADDAVARFSVTYDGLPAYGNMLVSRHECVYVTLRFIRPGKTSPAPTQTRCVKSPRG